MMRMRTDLSQAFQVVSPVGAKTRHFASVLLLLLPSAVVKCVYCWNTDNYFKVSAMLKSVSPQLSPSGAGSRVIRMSPDQEQTLEAQFSRVKNPHPTDLVLLAAETGLDERDVQAWYTHRLATWRKEQGLSTNLASPNCY